MKFLGILLTDNLKMTANVSATISTCTQFIYALQTLRSHGLSQQGLYDVCRSTTISKLMYASPAWWGYTSASDKSKIESMISKCMRLSYFNKSSPSAFSMASQADVKLLQSILTKHYHVLFTFFPPQKSHKYHVPSAVPSCVVCSLLFLTIYLLYFTNDLILSIYWK